MGCDIHVFIEKKNDAGAWEPATAAVPCHWCDATGKRQLRPENCHWCEGSGALPTYSERHHAIFAMLAGVRVNDDYPVPLIAPPRGLPDDMSEGLEEIYAADNVGTLDLDACEAKWGTYPGEHTPSWLSLRELMSAKPPSDLESCFFTHFIPALQKLGEPDSVRIVFDFDN